MLVLNRLPLAEDLDSTATIHRRTRRQGRMRRGCPAAHRLASVLFVGLGLRARGLRLYRQARCARASGSSRLLLTSCRTIGLAFCEFTFLDGRISARLAPDHLRRLAVSAEKGTSHSVAIPESGLLRDNVKGVVGVFHQRARPL